MKFVIPSQLTAKEELEFACTQQARFASLVWNGLNIVANREYGEEFLNDVVKASLAGEQKSRFQVALRKLGIEDDPPAVKAAKYHYFSNQIGGISSQIIIEGDKKAWLRHPSPQTSWPGLSFLALPPRNRRIAFSTWHPLNGQLIGCPRLRWVITKVRTEGQPYEEGYFEECERELTPSEVLAYEPVDRTPEFIESQAPVLDPAVWPEERVLRARRNYLSDYAQQTLRSIEQLRGPFEASRILEITLQGIAHQFTHQLMDDLSLSARNLDGVAETFSALLWLANMEHEIERLDSNQYRIHVNADQPKGALFARNASNLFPWLDLTVRILNGHLLLTREKEKPGEGESWALIDAGRWVR